MIVEVWCRRWKYPPSETVRPIQGAIWVSLSSDPNAELDGVKVGLGRRLVFKHLNARSSYPPRRPWLDDDR